MARKKLKRQGKRESRSAKWTVTSLVDHVLGGTDTTAGEHINIDTAYTVSAVFNAVTLLSEALGVAPLHVYKRGANDSRDRASDHPAYKLLHRRPNPTTTPSRFKRTLQAWKLLWGNAYAEIQRDDGGTPQALWPIHPSRVHTLMDGGGVLHKVYSDTGGGYVVVRDEDMLHIMGQTKDGVTGLSVVTVARESLGFSVAAEKFGASFFGNGARPGGVLEHPGTLSDDALKNLRATWQTIHGGSGNAGRTAILEEAMKYHSIGIPPEDAQFLETRVFQVVEVARWFNIPPHKLKELTRATFSNIEHQAIEYIGDSVLPHMLEMEEVCNLKLLTEAEQETYFCEFLAEGLMRGDLASRVASYGMGIKDGWLSRNEARRRENLNPADGLDDFLVPMNMAVVGDEPEPPPEPVLPVLPIPPEPEPEPEDDEQARAIGENLTAAFDRMIRMECNALGRALRIAETPDTYTTWVTDWWGKHAPEARAGLDAPLRVARGPDAAGVVAAHVSSSVGQLSGVARDAGDGWRAAIEERLAKWKQGRAGQSAADVMLEDVT